MSAFDLLMKKKTTAKRKHPPFIDCPAGCGARLFEKELNRHLDLCLITTVADEDDADSAHRGSEQQQRPKPPKAASGQSMSEPGRKKPRKEPMGKSERVVCPSCQMSVPKALINLHLDHCTSKSSPPPPPAKLKIFDDDDDDDDAPLVSCSPPDAVGTIDSSSSPDNISTRPCVPRVSQSPQTATAPASNDDETTASCTKKMGEKSNVFATMMANSKNVFAALDGLPETVMTQSCHLCADNQVKLRLRTLPFNEVLLSSRWSAVLTIKDKAEQGVDGDAGENMPLSFDVHLSSAIWSDLAPRRWVRYHSRLSVPVLKSLLQKSIRRRRPLDSVRIAMEVADKALGELLRRLPIIVMEDSTLHDGLDFLVWVMMAQSKGFSPPVSVMTRIFQIVFEVASCPRQDVLDLRDDDAIEASPLSLTKLYHNCEAVEAERGQALLWALLVRAEYGGMKGDVRMLRRFATLWSTRLAPSTLVPDEVISATSASNKPDQWAGVPLALHVPSRESSAKHVGELIRVPIDRLRIENLCPEAIDFHCSSVLECLVNDKAVVGLCHDLLLLSGSDLIASAPTTWLEVLAQRCMWKYSAGVNRRLPLIRLLKSDSAGDNDPDDDRYKRLWTDLLEPRTLAFQKQYINQRLVS